MILKLFKIKKLKLLKLQTLKLKTTTSWIMVKVSLAFI